MLLTIPLNILIIDDNDLDRVAVCRALRETDLPFELTEVCNCSTAVDALSQQPFDCVLLEYLLPDGNAIFLMQTLRDEGQTLPFIVLTGYGDEQIAVEAMKAGASDYLTKAKASPERLEQIIQGAIRLYTAEVQVKQTNQLLRETNEVLKVKTKQLEQQQQQIHLTNLQLVRASQLKSQFLATMSHEIRTPMNAIMGFSQILLQGSKGILTGAHQTMVQRIFDNSHHLLKLLNELLDFSKIESGHVEIEPTLISLPKLTLETTDELRALAERKNLQLTTHVQLDNRKIYTDPSRLKQILMNVISNAIKFTEQGGVDIYLSDLGEEGVAIAIHDTGIGIAAEDHEHIFEAFCQVDQSTTRKQVGTGLGLAITKSLVTLMQGEIEVESHLGSGSTFHITLPRHLDLALSPPATSPSSNVHT